MSFSNMYVGATGIIAHGNRMQVVSHNLANVNTVGYKRADAQFADLMSVNEASASTQYRTGAVHQSQIGKGVGLGTIRSIFKEGGLTTTNTTTDLAITGHGFYGVRKVASGPVQDEGIHYTRAGNFRFNKDAYLVDPNGYRLQGYAIDRDTGAMATTLSDIQLPYTDVEVDGKTTRLVQSDPKVTSKVEMIVNLNATSRDLHTSKTNPFFSLLESYAGNLSNAATPFGTHPSSYSSSLKVYDEDGNAHNLTAYFDSVNPSSISNATPGYRYWEYVLAVPGSSDGSAAHGTSSAGLVGTGVLTFNDLGQLVNHSAYSLKPDSSSPGKSLDAWQPATFASNGNPEFSLTYGKNGSAIGSRSKVSVNFGVGSQVGGWKQGAGIPPKDVGGDTEKLLALDGLKKELRSSTSFDTGTYTNFQNQDGFTRGYLQNTSFDNEGYMTGYFSNGQRQKFYQLALFRFNSEWGLRREGGNHFAATEASGDPIEGVAKKEGRGTIQQNTLEASNVDMAQEFATMILTQRGYQANSKVITTADSLMNTLISTKR